MKLKPIPFALAAALLAAQTTPAQAQQGAPVQQDAQARQQLKDELRKEIIEELKAEGWAPAAQLQSQSPAQQAAQPASAAPSQAAAQSALEASQATINLIQALVQNGILTQDKADELIRQAKQSAAEALAAQNGQGANKVVRVPYVPVTVRNEIKEELKKEVMAQAKDEGWAAPSQVPSWLSGMKWETEIRLREEQDRFDKNNFSPVQLGFAEDPITIGNSQDNTNTAKLRLRFGMEMQVSSMTTAGFRIATGNLTNPVSTNQTLGNNFDRYTVGVERAYITLTPTQWASMTGGRIANPFFSSDLVWAPDLNFDGVAGILRSGFSDTHSFWGTLGIFPLAKIDPAPNNAAQSKWLYGGQIGYERSAQAGPGLRLGVALYDYRNVEGIPNSGDLNTDPNATQFSGTAPGFRQKGNSIFNINQNVTNSAPGGTVPVLYGLASKFREFSLTGSLDFANYDPVHVLLSGDYVKNIGFDRAEILARTGRDIAPQTRGYQLRLSVGRPQVLARGDWQFSAAYRYLERDAVLDAYADTDFRLGGTDSKGYILSGNYGIDRNTWLALRWLSADPISGPPLKIDVLQFDLNSRF
jgi:hypothetical protein